MIVDREYVRFARLEIVVPKASILPDCMLFDGARSRVGIMTVRRKGGCNAFRAEESSSECDCNYGLPLFDYSAIELRGF